MFNNFPQNSREVFDRMQADFQSALPESNPFLKGSYLNSLIKSSALSIFDWYKALSQQINFLFPATATGESLDTWAQLQGVEQQVATQATGTISIGGLSGSSVPQNTLFNGTNGITYRTLNSVQISTKVNPVTAISKVGTTITVDLQDEHFLNNDLQVVISNADQAEYNGTFDINVTASNSFEYVISSDEPLPTNPTSMTATYTLAALSVESQTFGDVTNLEANSTLAIQSQIAGVNNSAGVTFLGLTGGADDESLESYRNRVLNAWKNPRTPLNVADIEFRCFQVPGVTRVWVKEVFPDIGQVSTYFVRDGDANIIPSAGEIQNVKDSILQSKSAFIDDADIIVKAPDPVVVDFNFSAISPDTPTMRQSIANNLEVFFRDNSNLGVDIQEISYQKAISDSIDLETGDVLQSFTLTTPTGVITVGVEQLAILGDITYA